MNNTNSIIEKYTNIIGTGDSIHIRNNIKYFLNELSEIIQNNLLDELVKKIDKIPKSERTTTDYDYDGVPYKNAKLDYIHEDTVKETILSFKITNHGTETS